MSSGNKRLGPDPSSAFSNSFHTVLFMVRGWPEGHQQDGEMAWSKGSLFSISAESQPSLTQKAGVDGSQLYLSACELSISRDESFSEGLSMLDWLVGMIVSDRFELADVGRLRPLQVPLLLRQWRRRPVKAHRNKQGT